MPKLLLKFQAAVIKEIDLNKMPLTIGRKPDNDLVIDNLAVSGHHARISQQGAIFSVEDLTSTNGTFINGKKVLNAPLKHDDQVTVGQHTLIFLYPESLPKPAAPVDADATVVLTPQQQEQFVKKIKEETAPQVERFPQSPEPSSPQKNAAPPVETPRPAPVQPPPQAAERPPAPPTEEEMPRMPARKDLSGTLRVIEGKTDQNEYPLTSPLTYIGKSENAAIRIKGLFAPDIAALVSKRPAGYLLTAVKDGYPKLNNQPVNGQVELKSSDVIEVGGLKLLFILTGNSPQ